MCACCRDAFGCLGVSQRAEPVAMRLPTWSTDVVASPTLALTGERTFNASVDAALHPADTLVQLGTGKVPLPSFMRAPNEE